VNFGKGKADMKTPVFFLYKPRERKQLNNVGDAGLPKEYPNGSEYPSYCL